MYNARVAPEGLQQYFAKLFAIAIGLCCSLSLADDRRSPDERTAAVLTEKGISYVEWLLYDGIYSKNSAQVAQALREGADANTARDFRGPYPAQSPLMGALYSGGQPDIIEALVRAGANVNLRFKGTPTPTSNQVSPAQQSFFAAADAVRDPRSKEFFPLYYAVDTSPPTVELLLVAGADPNAVGGSASQAIFKTYDVEVAGLLLKYGANINAKNYEGETVLAHARRELSQIWKGHYLYDKINKYCAWLVSLGAKE